MNSVLPIYIYRLLKCARWHSRPQYCANLQAAHLENSAAGSAGIAGIAAAPASSAALPPLWPSPFAPVSPVAGFAAPLSPRLP